MKFMFYDIYVSLCKEKGLKPSTVAEELGINKSNVSNWKNNGYTPRGNALNKIADYFNVSTDYLLSNDTEVQSKKVQSKKMITIAKTSNLNIQIDPDIKERAEQLFSQFGITITDAINMFLHQSLNFGGIPFELKTNKPNAVTLAAMKEADEIAKSDQGFDDVEDMLREMKS